MYCQSRQGPFVWISPGRIPPDWTPPPRGRGGLASLRALMVSYGAKRGLPPGLTPAPLGEVREKRAFLLLWAP